MLTKISGLVQVKRAPAGYGKALPTLRVTAGTRATLHTGFPTRLCMGSQPKTPGFCTAVIPPPALTLLIYERGMLETIPQTVRSGAEQLGG